jgi:succinate dehydrogenase/fumarate reductase flavoprotein subunit
LPIYADLPGMPENERRAIFGLMVANEGMTWILYKNYVEAGFDPDKDLLQAYSGGTSSRYDGSTLVGIKKSGYRSYLGGLVHDWDFKTSLEGLYAAGESLFSVHYHGLAATSGRWVGAKAADYAKDITGTHVCQSLQNGHVTPQSCEREATHGGIPQRCKSRGCRRSKASRVKL